ncbi:MAG TPA: carbamoyltransferase C-terminal domain-containing protein [Burkholderiales bacterium]|nr:carbamoyltransferase C-terminal domain-containing protein [Burkholderiales bacterium]
MYTLGINAAFHDSAACLVRDGAVIAAAEEERFNRIKHAKRPVPFSAWELPYHAIDYCLREAGIHLADVDHVAYSYDPQLFPGRPPDGAAITLPQRPSQIKPDESHANPWDALFYAYLVNAPLQLKGGAPLHLRKRLNGAPQPRFEWHYVGHHLAHEASAFLAAPYERCAVMTLDGRGERATTTFGVWRDGVYRRLKQIEVPHSLGLLYEDVTKFLGFLHSSDEYKVMALASYAQPTYLDDFRDIVRVDEQGNYRIVDPDLARRFGAPRKPGGPMEERHYQVAASLQKVLEETALKLARWLRNETGERELAMAGGVALNCVMNARIRDSGLFESVWVQPAAGDAGTALGAALWTDAQQRESGTRWHMAHANLGPGYADEEIEQLLRWSRLPYRRLDDVADETAELLAQDRIIGWFQGRMEFGPRALGARSILASPISPEMQGRLNELKDREDFRPVAPAVLEERLGDWFESAHPQPSAPFMLFIYDVKPGRAERIPAACHVDGTARVQTVNRASNPRYYDLLRAFEQRTGVPVLINTSFNSRGQPIVCSPRDAIEAFYSTPLDALVIGSFLLQKTA